MRPLALYFGAESMELSEASYVASFEAVRQGNKNVELLKNVNNDYVKHWLKRGKTKKTITLIQ